MTAAHWAALLVAATSLASPLRAPLQAAARTSTLAPAEAAYADWLDAVSALAAGDSGFTQEVAGRRHRAWAARLRASSTRLDAALAGIDAAALTLEDARAL